MDIVALLPERLMHPFRTVIRTAHTVRAVRDLRELVAVLSARPADIVVVDPQLAGPELDRYRTSMHIVLYTTVSADALKACHAMGTRGYRNVVLFGVDDEPVAFRALLEALPADELADALLALLRERLQRLPESLAEALEAVFRTPSVIDCVDRLADKASMPRRTIYDALERAGLATPAQHLGAARVMRAYHYLREPGARVRDVAVKLRYPSPDAMASSIRSVTGFLPSSLASQLERDDFVGRIATYLQPAAARTVMTPAD
ncbi:MAG TPA: helix-turn-helix domain-containing protein [Gemmatimonadaceae bacterium]|nr:helix-turn-helix domain-containing protein [Gemmatimonadaceae bacterium]